MPRPFTKSPLPLVELARLIVLVANCAVTGCANDGGSNQGPFISPRLDTSQQTAAMIGASGGSIQATASDGTIYILSIPADALAEETEISLTPVREISDLPMSGGMMGAVHFEPSGLELLRAATLTVELPSAPALGDGEVLAGFTYEGDGENLALALAEVDGETYSIPVHHFSGGGAGAATPSDLEAAFAPGTADAFVAKIIAELNASDTPVVEPILARWYAELVKPALQAAVASDQALERGLRERRRWVDALLMLGADLNDLFSEGHSLAAAAFREAIARANDLCERQESFAEAEEALAWQRRAEGTLPDDVLFENGIDRESVDVDLCVQVLYESTSFPDAPIAGEPEPFRVVVGYAFGNGPIEHEAGMVVNVLAIDARPAGTTTTTDGSGRVELALTPDGGNLRIEVDTCIGNVSNAGPLTSGFVCQEAFIVRGLVVSPVRTTLVPGGRQQFTAELVGIEEPVTWSAAGGTIDDDGLFVAGGTAGTFTITATSIDDPSLIATAEVTIEVNPSDDFPTSATWQGPVVLHRENGTTFVQEGWLATSYDPSTGTLQASTCQGSEDNCLGDRVGCDALWEGTVSGNQLSMTQVNHTNGCAIGQPGQNRGYGCTLTATFSEAPDGTMRLVGNGDSTFFSCTPELNVTFDACVGGCPE